MENPLQENNPSENDPVVPPTDNPLTDQTQPTTPQQPNIPTIQTPLEPPPSAKSKKRLILVIIIIATIFSLGLAAFFVYQNYQVKQQVVPTQPTPIPTPTLPSPTPDPTANWKTYISEGGKFSFKYPSDWIYETQKPTLNIQGKKYIAYAFISGIPLTKEQQKMSKLPDRNDTPKPRKSFSIIYATSSDFNNLDADDLIEELTGKLTETFSQRDVALNGNIKAKEVRYACQEDCLDVLFNYNDMIFEASTIPISETDINTLYQILSTFKFIDQKQASCKDINFGSKANVGITFLEDYCIGHRCQGFTTETECESVDLVKVENGKLLGEPGKDGVYDCVWNENETSSYQCKPKY